MFGKVKAKGRIREARDRRNRRQQWTYVDPKTRKPPYKPAIHPVFQPRHFRIHSPIPIFLWEEMFQRFDDDTRIAIDISPDS